MTSKKVLSIMVVLVLIALPAAAANKPRVWNDATRLGALLHDVQARNITFSEAVWRTVANEANMLANRIYGNTAGDSTARAAADDLRDHVREMRTAALAGNAAEARRHAALAQPFAHRLIEWSMPAR